MRRSLLQPLLQYTKQSPCYKLPLPPNIRLPKRYINYRLDTTPLSTQPADSLVSPPRQHNTTIQQIITTITNDLHSPTHIPTHIKDKIITNLHNANELLVFATNHPNYLPRPNYSLSSPNPFYSYPAFGQNEYYSNLMTKSSQTFVKNHSPAWSCLPYYNHEYIRAISLSSLQQPHLSHPQQQQFFATQLQQFHGLIPSPSPTKPYITPFATNFWSSFTYIAEHYQPYTENIHRLFRKVDFF